MCGLNIYELNCCSKPEWHELKNSYSTITGEKSVPFVAVDGFWL